MLCKIMVVPVHTCHSTFTTNDRCGREFLRITMKITKNSLREYRRKRACLSARNGEHRFCYSMTCATHIQLSQRFITLVPSRRTRIGYVKERKKKEKRKSPCDVRSFIRGATRSARSPCGSYMGRPVLSSHFVVFSYIRVHRRFSPLRFLHTRSLGQWLFISRSTMLFITDPIVIAWEDRKRTNSSVRGILEISFEKPRTFIVEQLIIIAFKFGNTLEWRLNYGLRQRAVSNGFFLQFACKKKSVLLWELVGAPFRQNVSSMPAVWQLTAIYC